MKRLVDPISYDLEFEPDFKKFTFSAKAKIIARCNSSTPKIVMDCAELKIRSCKVSEGKKPIKCTVKTNAKSKIFGVDELHLAMIFALAENVNFLKSGSNSRSYDIGSTRRFM